MNLHLLKHLFQPDYPTLDWIQVEISSYCDANCIYCPHKAYKENWQNRLLSIEVFEKLIPAFPKTALVHLQGWGEPFTHPRLLDMLRIAKRAGCMVGTNTNGNLLQGEKIETLVKEGLDIIGFSLAGIDEKNDSIRVGTKIKQVQDCIDKINSAKAKFGVDKPKIHIAYMLLHSGLDDLEKMPEFLNGLGVYQVVISSLSLITDPSLKSEALLVSDEREYIELKKRLLEIKQTAKEKGTGIYFHLVSPQLTPSYCSENIGRAVVVGSNGDVSPCVMTQIPVTGKNHYYFNSRKKIIENMSFGNINDEPFNTIRSRKEYKKFIHAVDSGNMPNICLDCYKKFIDTLI